MPCGGTVLRAQALQPSARHSRCHQLETHRAGERRGSPAAAGSPRVVLHQGVRTHPLRARRPWGEGDRLAPCPCTPARVQDGNCSAGTWQSGAAAGPGGLGHPAGTPGSAAEPLCAAPPPASPRQRQRAPRPRGGAPRPGAGHCDPVPCQDTQRSPRGRILPPTCRQAWICGSNPAHNSSSSSVLGGCGATAAGVHGFFLLRMRLLWGATTGLGGAG